MRRIISCHALLLSITALALQAPAKAASVPFWGAKASVPIDTPIDDRACEHCVESRQSASGRVSQRHRDGPGTSDHQREEPITSHALVLTEGPSSTPDPYVPDATKYRWVRVGVPGHTQEAGTQVTAAALARIKVPPEFVRQVNSIVTPRATVLVTGEALSPQSSGPIVRVVDADPPAGHAAPEIRAAADGFEHRNLADRPIICRRN